MLNTKSNPITSVGGDGRTYVLCTEQGQPAVLRQVYTSFRGDDFVLEGGAAPKHEGSSGRVWASSPERNPGQAEFYPKVLGLKWELLP